MAIRQFNKIKIVRCVIMIIIILFLFLPQISQAKTLAVPFTSQAPYGNWQQPWQDFCEEASILMIDYYYAEKTLDKATAFNELLKIQKLRNNLLGWSLDEDASKIIKLINSYFPWEAKVVNKPSLADLQKELDNNHPVIIPAYGKALHNPHFQNGGPDYHTLVLTGYDSSTEKFISNDPGTRYGLDFYYSFATIMDALHDFIGPGKTKNGPKVAIFTQKTLTTTQSLDTDKDGLTKAEEIKHQTKLWLADTDNDGYTDGLEVSRGYSPTLAENKLSNGSLIKSVDKPKVYLLKNGSKRHIINAEVFTKHGWQWGEIKIVSDKFLSNLATGTSIEN